MSFLESISGTGRKAELGSGTILLVWGDPSPLILGRDLLCEIWVCCTRVKSFVAAESRRKQRLLMKADDQNGHKWLSSLQPLKQLCLRQEAAARSPHEHVTRYHFLVNDLLCWNWTEMCSAERTIPLSCPHPEATHPHSQRLLWTEKAPLQPGQIFLCYSHVLSISRGSRRFSSDGFFPRTAE